MSDFMRSVKTLALGMLLGVAGPSLHAQAKPAVTAANPAPQAQAKPAAQVPAKSSAPAATPQAKPAAPTAKPATQAANSPQATKPATAKPVAKKPAAKAPTRKKAPKPAASTPKPADAEREPKIARRDPFESLVGHEQAGGKTGPFPPGKAGLQVSTLRLDGIVRSPGGMIAVVSNPQSRTYFLREGDQLYDGRVEKIAMDGVSFHEIGKDAFGKPVERQVNKRIYASAGEQQ
jgi:Tfp pilus assembly protein PilP